MKHSIYLTNTSIILTGTMWTSRLQCFWSPLFHHALIAIRQNYSVIAHIGRNKNTVVRDHHMRHPSHVGGQDIYIERGRPFSLQAASLPNSHLQLCPERNRTSQKDALQHKSLSLCPFPHAPWSSGVSCYGASTVRIPEGKNVTITPFKLFRDDLDAYEPLESPDPSAPEERTDGGWYWPSISV